MDTQTFLFLVMSERANVKVSINPSPSKKQTGRTRSRSHNGRRRKSKSQDKRRTSISKKTIKREVGRDVKRIFRSSLPKTRALIPSGKSLPKPVQQLLSSILLPYEGALLRVRDGFKSSISVASAITRNHFIHNVNLTTLMAPNPVCGILSGRPIFEDLTVSVPIVNVLDPYLFGIVPFRVPTSLDQVVYTCGDFANANQNTIHQYEFTPPATAIVVTGGKVRYLGPTEDTIYWLDPVHFIPQSVQQPYGEIHPCFDAPDGRYVWLDSLGDPFNALHPHQRTTISCAVNCAGTWGLENLDTSGGVRTTLNLVVQSLPSTQSNSNDVITYTGNFLPSWNPMGITASAAEVTILQSGYYKIGLSGSFKFTQDGETLDNLILTGLNVQLNFDERINTFARHLVNPNITSSFNPSSYNLFDTVKVNSGSCLVRNTTPTMFKGGAVYAVTNTTDRFWFNFTNDSNSITAAYDSSLYNYNGDWVKGCYGWLRRSGFDSFRPGVEVVTAYDGTSLSIIRSYSITRLTDVVDARWAAMNIFLLAPTDSNSVNLTSTLVFTNQWEFTTINQIPVLSSKANASGSDANAILINVPTFTENPLHLGMFGDIIRSAGRKIVDFYKDNRSIAKSLFSAMSAFGGPITSLAGRVFDMVDDSLVN